MGRSMGINQPYLEIRELPDVIPVFPLSGVLLLPKRELPLNIFEPRYLAMTDDVLRTHRLVGMIQPRGDESPSSLTPQLQDIGCLGRITQFAESGDGRYFLTLTGIARFEIETEVDADTLYRLFRVQYDRYLNDLSTATSDTALTESDVSRLVKLFEQARGFKIDKRAIEGVSIAEVIDAFSMKIQFGLKEKQALLEASDVTSRGEMLAAIAEMEVADKSGTPRKLQ
jgi:Lon protease-like protein